MKTSKCVLILVVMMATATGCWAIDKPATNEKTDAEVVVEGANKFALELYAKLRAKKGNLFFSPYSISTALAMTYAGARGETETQMARALHFPTRPSGDPNKGAIKSAEQVWDGMRFHSAFGAIIKDLNTRGEKGGYELSVANALWGQRGYEFLEEFLELIKTNYDGGLGEVDFVSATEAARQIINTWVEKETNNKIKNLIGPGVLDELTRLVLTNAIYFKGNWASRFKKEDTKDAPFTLSGGEKIDVAMMNQTAEFKYMETEDFQGLELAYVDEELSMIIFLPKKIDGLGRLEKMLTAENLSDWLAELHAYAANKA